MFAAPIAKRGDSIHEGTAKQHEIGTGGQRLGNIETRLDPAIDNQRNLVADNRTDIYCNK